MAQILDADGMHGSSAGSMSGYASAQADDMAALHCAIQTGLLHCECSWCQGNAKSNKLLS